MMKKGSACVNSAFGGNFHEIIMAFNAEGGEFSKIGFRFTVGYG